MFSIPRRLPPRFRESSFQRFAHVIGLACKTYPDAVKVDPSPLSAESYKQPLRDAITAKARWGYKHASVPDELFSVRHASLVVVSDDNGMVYIGSREAVATRQGREVGKVDNTLSGEITVEREHLPTVCILLHVKAFSPVPNFVVHRVDEVLVASLENQYDVAFAPDANVANKYFLIGPLNLQLPSPTK